MSQFWQAWTHQPFVLVKKILCLMFIKFAVSHVSFQAFKLLNRLGCDTVYLADGYQCFQGTCHLHLHGRRVLPADENSGFLYNGGA